MEDPTLKSYVDSHTGQSIISGMGELHLEIIQERIKREYEIQTKLGKRRVAYYETIRKPAIGEEKYMKQSAGKGQYGHVVLEFKPYDGDGKFKFTPKIKANVIPKEFYAAIEQGVLEAMDIGDHRRLPHHPRRGRPAGRLVPRGGLDRSWRTRSPLPWPSRTPSARAARSCSSR